MKHKLTQLISIIIIAAFASQGLARLNDAASPTDSVWRVGQAWGWPGQNDSSLRARSFDERSDTELIVYGNPHPVRCRIGNKLYYYQTVFEVRDKVFADAQKGDFSSLAVDWDVYLYDWLIFSNYAKGTNEAVKYALDEGRYQGFNDPEGFLRAAISTRLGMIENYILPLSEEGRHKVSRIEEAVKKSIHRKELEKMLRSLMDPKESWFVNPLVPSRLRSVVKKGDMLYLRAVNGCTGQCDHCDAALGVLVTPMSWIVIKKAGELAQAEGIEFMLDEERCDIFRDFYDFVYDKDPSDIILGPFEKIGSQAMGSTHGCLPGSVGELALRRAVRGGYKYFPSVSVVPSALMRRLGYDGYKEMLKNIFYLMAETKHPISANCYQIRRDEDPEWVDSEKITNAVVEEMCLENPQLLKSTKILVSDVGENIRLAGRLYRLTRAGVSFNFKHYLYENTAEYLFPYGGNSEFILMPNGAILKWEKLTAKYMSRTRLYKYKEVVPGLKNTPILCTDCVIHCKGKGTQKSPCPGRVFVMESWGLSPTGGEKLPLTQI